MRIILIFGRILTEERLRIRMTVSFSGQENCTFAYFLVYHFQSTMFLSYIHGLTSAYEFYSVLEADHRPKLQDEIHGRSRIGIAILYSIVTRLKLSRIRGNTRIRIRVHTYFHVCDLRLCRDVPLPMASCFALRNEMILQIVETRREFKNSKMQPRDERIPN